MVTFFLVHPSKAKSAIYILVSANGKQYRRSTGESTLVKFWNKNKKRVKSTSDNPIAVITNDILDKQEGAAVRAIANFKEFFHPPLSSEFFAQMDKEFYRDDPTTERTPMFAEYMQTYINRYKSSKSPITVKKYVTALNKIIEFEKSQRKQLRFEDINIEFYNRFQQWFNKFEYSDNYFGVLIKVIKQIYREAKVVDKFHSGEDIAHKDFITIRKSVDSIYLTETELLQLRDLDISEAVVIANFPDLTPNRVKQKISSLKTVRNRFLIGAYTGLRVSDFGRLCDDNVGEYIKIKTTKTGSDLVIPIHPVIREILDDGFDLSETLSDQKMNKHLKELGRLVGFNENIKLSKSIGGIVKEVICPKYELMTTHTARRSFATNAYKAGIPSIAIMKITGHTKESTFLKYIKVSAEENAEMLSNHPFFSTHK